MYISTKRERIEPLKGCSMVGIIEGLLGIEGGLPLVHGPLSCSSGHRMVYLFADKEPILPTTALIEEDLIMGSQEKLKYALNKAYEIYKPKYLIIIITCAISLSGEEFNKTINEFEKKNECKVSVLDGSGLYGEESDGFNLLYSDFLEKFEISNRKESNIISLDGLALSDVNVKNKFSIITNMLKTYTDVKIGPSLFLDFNIQEDIKDYKKSNKIKIGHLWNQYELENNIPAPYGIEGTYNWLKWLDNKIVHELNENLKEEYLLYKNQLAKKIKDINFDKLKVVVEGDSWSALGLAGFLQNELGCELLVSTDNYGVEFDKKHKIIDHIHNDMGGYELFLKTKEFKPDIVFGSSYIRCKKKWKIVPFAQPIYHLYENDTDILGFEGAFNLINILSNAL